MACGGPSKDFAIIRSAEAYNRIMELLKDHYDVYRPDSIGIAKGFEKRMQDEWDEDAKKLKEALADLFWVSDSASF